MQRLHFVVVTTSCGLGRGHGSLATWQVRCVAGGVAPYASLVCLSSCAGYCGLCSRCGSIRVHACSRDPVCRWAGNAAHCIIYICICMYMYLYVYVSICICIYVYIYLCVYMCIFLCSAWSRMDFMCSCRILVLVL